MSLAKGTPFDALFAALTERMGVLHTASPDTDPSQRDRVEWKHAGFAGRVKRGYRKPGTVTTGFQGHKYEVSIYGATELEVAQRAADLAGWLDYLVGPAQGAADAGDGYELGTASPIVGGEGTASGYGCKLLVTLYVPEYQQIWGQAPVRGVSVTPQAQHTDGTLEDAFTATG